MPATENLFLTLLRYLENVVFYVNIFNFVKIYFYAYILILIIFTKVNVIRREVLLSFIDLGAKPGSPALGQAQRNLH